jgi:hypothetical protein
MRRIALILPLLGAIWVAQAQPATQPSERIEAMLRDAASIHPAVRSQARHDLLGLSAADLPTLKNVASSMRPLRSEQWLALRDTVLHLSAAPLPVNGPKVGFLGLSQVNVGMPFDSDVVQGAIVPKRSLGYDVYRALEEGDVITGVDYKGDTLPIFRWNDLVITVQKLTPGQETVLHIRRDMETLAVRVKVAERADLDSRADINEQDQFNSELDSRVAVGRKRWSEEFVPAIGPRPGSVGQRPAAH